MTTRTGLIAATGLALALAAPAFGQGGYAPMAPDAAPRSNAPAEVLGHAQSQARGGASGAPVRDSAGRMGQASRRADQLAGREADRLLEEAERALRAGNWPLATELTERAQTALLNEHVVSGGQARAGTGAEAMRATGEAATAMSTRDRSRAGQALREARIAAGRMGSEMTGPGMRPMPGQGMGGPAPATPGMMPGMAPGTAPGMGPSPTSPQPGIYR